VSNISATLAEAQNQLNSGHLKTAQEQAYAADTQMTHIQNTVASALQKIETWKQKRRVYPRG
jgi:outer membrane PBP1 activator LpoA protein